jgi:hypothetical protein
VIFLQNLVNRWLLCFVRFKISTRRPCRPGGGEPLARKLIPKSRGVPLIPEADCQRIAMGVGRRREDGGLDILSMRSSRDYPRSIHAGHELKPLLPWSSGWFNERTFAG